MDAGYGSGAHSRAFMRALGAAGWLSMGWPRALRRPGAADVAKLVLLEELALAGAPFGPLAGAADGRRIIRYGTRAPAARDPAARRARRGHVLAGLQRARRGLGPARAQDRGPARRRSLGDPRPQDLVEPRGHRGLRPRARAHEPRGPPQPRPQHVRGRQRHAGHGHPPDPQPDRRGLSLRGLPRRRARAADRMLGREGEGFRRS